MTPTEPAAAVDLLRRPLSELAALVRDGQVTSRELVEASLEAIEDQNGRLNAFTHVDADGALAAADAIAPGDERPFAGVPFAIKDLFTPVAGWPQSQGCSLFDAFVPPYDTFVVRRLRDAGLVFVGATNVPEFGITPTTESRRLGACHNPWDLDRTSGGSSGGSASAVAGGLVPAAHATDGGGSIRIPAACCGLVGLKPQRGRVSVGPELGDSILGVTGSVTRTVAESAALLDVLAGPEPGDATWAPPPIEPFAAAARHEPGRLRVAVSVEPPVDVPVDPSCAAAARETGELLASLGHEVVEATPPIAPGGIFDQFMALWAPLSGMGVSFGGVVAGREPTREDVELLTWELYEQGRATDAIAFQLNVINLQGIARTIAPFFAEHDVLVTPTLAQPPIPLGTIDPESPGAMWRGAEFAPFTATFNLTGQPAISLPLVHGDDGLPRGVQIVGPPLGEGLLLSLAGQLEAARPWADRLPPAA